MQRFRVFSIVGRLVLAVLAIGFASGRPASSSPAVPPVSDACDRTCLKGFADEYLSALAAHDPSRLQVTNDVKFTEDTAPLKLGDGLWQTITGVGTYRIDCIEPEAGEIASINVIEENKLPALMAVRLKVVNHKISEVETVVARSQGEANNDIESAHTDKLVRPDPLWGKDVPVSARPSREEMIATVNKYFDGIVASNGKSIPFASTAYRILNGSIDCNIEVAKNIQEDEGVDTKFDTLTCPDQIDTGMFKYVSAISPRRFLVVDRQKGLVLALIRYNHPGNVLSIHLTDGTIQDMTTDSWGQHPTSSIAAELFQVRDGQIHRIWGVYTKMHYKNPVGWDNE